MGLMDKNSGFHDTKTAKYYATRGKLTNLDATYFGHTALTHASYEGHLDIVEALLARGADKNRADSCGYTPLNWVARNGRVEILKTPLGKSSEGQGQHLWRHCLEDGLLLWPCGMCKGFACGES